MPALRSRLVIGLAAALAAVVAVAVVLSLRGGGSDERPTPLQIVLREVGDDGTWSKETALRAFAAVFGPLPGVEVPEGAEAEGEFGTVAIRMLARYIDDITPQQRAAAVASAGSLARFLTGDAADGDAAPATGVPMQPGVQAAAAEAAPVAVSGEEYEDDITAIVTAIESRIGRPLGIEVEVVVSPQPKGILYATANPLADDGKNITGCQVTVLPNAQNLQGKNLTAVLAHETWHCFEYSRLGTIARRDASPPWIIEGQAMWVGEAVVGGTVGLEPTERHWKEYLVDPGPGIGLFARSYDAIGFYSHLHDRGIDPWTVLDPILDATSNLAAFDAATGGQSLDVVTTWAPSWYRDGQPTSTFALVNAPGILGTEVRPFPDAFTVSSGTFQQVTAAKPLSAAIADVAIAADILTIDVSGQGLVGDLVFGDQLTFVSQSRTFCMIEDCTCPSGAAGPTQGIGDELRVTVTGDALLGSDALVRGWSLSEWCDEDEPDPPGSDVPGTPCASGCGSSNGDPHLTTIDGRSYDFQAAGEFVLLRSDAVEVQARQEPYQGSTAVTINTAVAVASESGRAGVYATGAGLIVTVDGEVVPTSQPVTSGDLRIAPVADGVQITAADGTVVWALGIGEWGINLIVAPSPQMRDGGTGLLSATGSSFFPAMPDGSDPDDEPRAALYTDLAEAWAVTSTSSLFDYDDGTGPDDFRDLSIPEPGAPLSLEDLADELRLAGLEACAGIADEALLAQCAFDVAVTGDDGFVASYQATDVFVTTPIPEEEPGSIDHGALGPLLDGVTVIAGAAVDDDGTLYLSLRHTDQTSELVAVDVRSQEVVAQVATEEDGPIVAAGGRVWMSTVDGGGCRVLGYGGTLEAKATVEVPCVFSILAPQLVAREGAAWVYGGAPDLTRIDPASATLGESIALPFGGGFLRASGDTVFYTSIDDGVHRLLAGSAEFEPLSDLAIVHPGGTGFWAQGDETVEYHDGPGAADVVVASDGLLVAAVDGWALVQHSGEDGAELWGYPTNGAAPMQLAAGPDVGTGSERRILDYFDNEPLLTIPHLAVKVWLESAEDDDGFSLFAQAIEIP